MFGFLMIIYNCIIDPTGAKLSISAGHSCSYGNEGGISDKDITGILVVETGIIPCFTMLNRGC